MKKIMKARKGGFTLVELLIVIIIIAILAGMMLLTTGAATDGAEATKLLNNLRSMKSASLLYFLDQNQTWPDGNGSDLADSLSIYMDRSIDHVKYTPQVLGPNADGRYFIGFNATSAIWTEKPGIEKKLAGMAKESGLYADDQGTQYTEGKTVYMNLR